MQRGIIELEFFQTVSQAFILIGFGRIQTSKNLRLNLLKAGQRFCRSQCCTARARFDQSDRIAHLGGLELFDAGDDVAHFTCFQGWTLFISWCEHTDFVGVVGRASGHHLDAVVFSQTTIHHTHQHHHTHIAVKPAVDDHGTQRCIRVAARWRHFGHDHLQDVVDTQTGFG